MFCHRDYLDFEVPGEDVDFDSAASLQEIVDKWTSLYAATSEMHDKAAFDALPADKQVVGARHRGRPHLLFRHQVFRADEGASWPDPDGTEKPVHMGSYGIGPSRLVAAIIEACHDEAGINWPEAVAPFDVVDPQPQAGRCRDRCAPASSSTRS